MISKFLQEEDSRTELTSKPEIVSSVEKIPADILTLPETQASFENPPEIYNEIPVFRESGEIIEPIPLPENQEKYTVAPSDAVVQGQNQELLKNQTTVESPDVNLRRTGLAWSAATVLGGSVVFMLILGWFFDLVFGSKPWGVVGGITLGALIGFIQFFRITSQIFKNDDDNSLGIN